MMTPIDVSRAQEIASAAGLRPARVKGTHVVQLTRSASANLEPIAWADFTSTLAERGLQLYESRGWLKIMK